jgi:hypothetical protein
MTRQRTHSWRLKAIVGAAFAGLGIAVLLGSLELATGQLCHFLGTAGWEVLGALPSLVQATLQALQALAFDFERSLHCPLQMLTSLWPLVTVMAGAI